MLPEQPCVSRLPGEHRHPGLHPEDHRARLPRRLRRSITASNLLPSVCGRVCPQENQCEGVCTVGESLEPVAIGRLERWVGDLAIKEGWSNVPYIEPKPSASASWAPARPAWACAADMAKAGCEVTVYEAFHEPGGVLKYGIPDFRLPNSIVDEEIKKLEQLGVRFECNTLVGRLFTIEQMIEEMGFHAVFVGTGAGYPSFMGIPGESLNGVLSANELLTRCNLMHARGVPGLTNTPMAAGQAGGRDRRRQHRDGRAARLPAAGADSVNCLYRAAGPRRRRVPRKSITRGGRDPFPLAGEPGGNPGRRQQERARRALRAHDARRARRVGATPPGARARQRVRDRGRHGRVRDRHKRPTRSSARPRSSSSTSVATSPPTRTSRPRSPACSPAATS